MILKALADYYDRLADDPSVDVAPPGFERKAVDFAVVINDKGEFENLRDLREGTGRQRKGRVRLIPRSVKRAAGIAANLLWDTSPYALGRATPERGKDLDKLQTRAVLQHQAFVDQVSLLAVECDDIGLRALLRFLETQDKTVVFAHPTWTEIEASGGVISFVLSGDSGLICQRSNVVQAIRDRNKVAGKTQVCAVSGIADVPAKLHAAIKGVWGAQSSGANIVSFNLGAFCSYGKEQGYNVPIGSQAEFAYTTALNYLLASERQRMQVGDASTVFWAKDTCDLESDLPAYLNPKKGEESVSYDKIRSLLSAAKTGIPPQEGDIPFYVLGLAPNASRLSVRFWYDGSVKEVKERMAQHFADIEIIRAPHDPEFVSLFQLLVSTATEHKADNIPPNLGGDVMRSVLKGGAYPRTLLTNAIRRCKAEQKIDYQRASLIKGVLARQARLTKATTKEVGVSLDREYGNIGYVLGRLFAVLEQIQEQAQGRGLNKTIRDTYFGAAASSPLVTFKRLQDLAIHHLAKIRNGGKNNVWLERLLQEVMDQVQPQGIPSILGLEDQGRFAVGYYHQRQDFFTKKDTVETETTTEGEDA